MTATQPEARHNDRYCQRPSDKRCKHFSYQRRGHSDLARKAAIGQVSHCRSHGPNGFYNEWLDSAGYENGVLADDADGSYYVDFEITTDRIYAPPATKTRTAWIPL